MSSKPINGCLRGAHPRAAACLFPVLLLATAGGCYGPSKTLAEPVMLASVEEEEPPPKPTAKPTPPAASVVQPPAAAAKPAVAAAGSREAKDDAEERPAKPPMPKRPANLQEWAKDDFISARKDNDAALPQAVQHVVRTWPKDDETVELLAAMLARSEASGQTPHASSLTVAGLVIPYFATSESPVAKQSLMKILRGELATDLDDARAVDLVLRSMVQAVSPEHEETLVDILADPQSWRPTTSAGVKAETLHETCLKIVRPAASSELRTRLAQRIVKDSQPGSHREHVGAWLAEPGPLNLAAQVVLHNSALLGSQHKARFRETFAGFNSPALDQLLGVAAAPIAAPSGGGLFRSAAAGDGASQSIELLRMFWAPDFVNSVSRDLAQMSDIGSQRELMLLGSNLPHRAVREELYRALRRQWEDGTKPFETARLTLDAFRDPGMLVLVKSMPREEKKPTSAGGGATASPARPTPEREAKYAWMAAAEGFVNSLNDRFHTAARSQPRGATSASTELPLSLHKGLSVTAEYHLDWPADLADGLAKVPVDPLVVHYVRMEGEERLQRVSDFFRRQMQSPASHTIARGQWLDSQQAVEETGCMRSVDVMITRDAPTPPRSPLMAEDLLVELLWIEIPDPTR